MACPVSSTAPDPSPQPQADPSDPIRATTAILSPLPPSARQSLHPQHPPRTPNTARIHTRPEPLPRPAARRRPKKNENTLFGPRPLTSRIIERVLLYHPRSTLVAGTSNESLIDAIASVSRRGLRARTAPRGPENRVVGFAVVAGGAGGW